MSFVIGVITGMYVAQTYKIPAVRVMFKTAYDKISEYELSENEKSEKKVKK